MRKNDKLTFIFAICVLIAYVTTFLLSKSTDFAQYQQFSDVLKYILYAAAILYFGKKCRDKFLD